MPKIVDHEQRRQECVDALWRVVSRDGAAAISVRSVAAEAGMSPTNLTHYFPSRAEMLAAVVRRHIETGSTAVKAASRGDLTLERAIDGAMAVIPTTPERRRQSQIWLLLVHERHSSEVADRLLRDLQRQVLRAIVGALRLLDSAGLLGADRQIDVEAHRLHALIDGLSLQSVSDPRGMSAAQVRRIVEMHFHELSRPA